MTHPNPADIDERIYSEASEWLIEFRSGDIDAAGRKRFHAWLAKSPEHMRAYLELAAIWNEGHALDRNRTFDDSTLLKAIETETRVVPLGKAHGVKHRAILTHQAPRSREDSLRAPRQVKAALAACVTLVALSSAAGSYWYFNYVRDVYTTGVGEQHRMTLADGSVVELNALSRVHVRFRDHERDVELLEGQALFQVAHDSKRPFIVRTENAQIRAVGTQFDVYRQSAGTKVTVIEGTVAVRRERAQSGVPAPREGDGTPVPGPGLESPRTTSAQTPSATPRPLGELLLKAGQQALITAQLSEKQENADVKAATAWTEGRLVFQGTPLQQVAAEFNRYNTPPLVISDPELADFKVTGIFSSTSPAPLIRFLEARPEMRVTRTDRAILVAASYSKIN